MLYDERYLNLSIFCWSTAIMAILMASATFVDSTVMTASLPVHDYCPNLDSPTDETNNMVSSLRTWTVAQLF